MKICPKCNKTYTDDQLNFCLEDGTTLTFTSSELPETVMLNPPGQTFPNVHQTSGNMPNTMQSGWQQTPNYSLQPQPAAKSSAWKWVLGMLGILFLLCGGGFVGLIVIGILYGDDNTVDYNANNDRIISNTNTLTDPDRKDTLTTGGRSIPLETWVRTDNEFGITQFSEGELIVSSKARRYFYVLLAPAGYSTEDAVTSVTVRNSDNSSSTAGYGLVFHSSPKALQQGYAFLIDAKLRRYRIVRHNATKEIDVVKWTNSKVITGGTEPNVLEVRDKSGNMEFFVNGTKVHTLRNTYGYKSGSPGVYSGDMAKAAFSNLNIK